MTRRLVGLDLNGWRDLAFREASDDDDAAEGVENGRRGPRPVEGGVGSVVVDMGEEAERRAGDRRYVGGPQALLSPIGRGGGWGAIGDPKLRTPVRTLLAAVIGRSSLPDLGEKLRAAAEALTVDADDVVAVVPDLPALDAEVREVLLTGLRRKGTTVRLLWRPVAVLLSALEDGRIEAPRDGLRVACLHLGQDGLETQVLTLRRLADHDGLFAPERASAGSLVSGVAGLEALRAGVVRAQEEDDARTGRPRHEPSMMPSSLLIDAEEPEGTEILRADNGTWLGIPKTPRSTVRLSFDDLRLDLGSADLALLTTPAAPALGGPLADRLRRLLGAIPLVELPMESGARGAFLAGRRIDAGIPHYLDHLEPMELLVLRDGEVVRENLLPEKDVVPANQVYRSKPIMGLSWPAGSPSVAFYIVKGGEFRRWWTKPIPAPADARSVAIELEQMPAQGRATVRVTSSTWDALRGSPIVLDWETLERDPRGYDQIAADLKPKPIVPDRVIATAHLSRWTGHGRTPAFGPFILAFSLTRPGALHELGSLLRAAPRIDLEIEGAGPNAVPVRITDFDGNVPDDADPDAVRAFDACLKRISDVACHAAGRGAPLPDNGLLTAATWAFGRCPSALQDEMIRAVQALFAERSHAFLGPKASERVLLHGIGRVVTDRERLARVLDILVPHWTRGNVLAALASLLSRPAATPDILDEQRTARIAKVATALLEHLDRTGGHRTNLKYALFLVAGLLRCREARPMALLRSTSADAAKLHAVLSRIRSTLAGKPERTAPITARIAIIDDLTAMLDGTGGRAEILVAIDELADDDDAGSSSG